MDAGHWWTASNLLSLSRLVLAVFIVGSISKHRLPEALILLAVAALTDLLDGWVARATHTKTPLGQLLDPIADKVLLNAVFLGLALAKLAPWWYVALVFARDLFLVVSSPFVLAAASHRELRPSLLGKASTVLQIATAAALLGNLQSIGLGLIALSTAATLASGVQYGMRGFRSLQHR